MRRTIRMRILLYRMHEQTCANEEKVGDLFLYPNNAGVF